MNHRNRYLEALKESYNAIGMAGAVALSAATLTPYPFLAALVLEAAYLLIVPDTKWYQARLSRRFDAEVEKRRQQLKDETLPLLRPEMQERFRRLEETRTQIDTQSQQDERWFREVRRKLDFLLDKFLTFAAKEVQFYTYLNALLSEAHGESYRTRNEEATPGYQYDDFNRKKRGPRRPIREEEDEAPHDLSAESADPRMQRIVAEVQAHYARERERLAQAIESEKDYDTRAILEKRADILQRREEFALKIGKILTNLNHQLQLVEDTFGLINDEIRARSPEQILADIEEVVVTTNTMASALEELAPIEQMVARLSN